MLKRKFSVNDPRLNQLCKPKIDPRKMEKLKKEHKEEPLNIKMQDEDENLIEKTLKIQKSKNFEFNNESKTKYAS